MAALQIGERLKLIPIEQIHEKRFLQIGKRTAGNLNNIIFFSFHNS